MTYVVLILVAGCFCLVGHVWVSIRFDTGTVKFIVVLLDIFLYMTLFTYNFFLQLMAEERGLLVDVEGFNNAMDEARERSRNAQNKVLHFFFWLHRPHLVSTSDVVQTFFPSYDAGSLKRNIEDSGNK